MPRTFLGPHGQKMYVVVTLVPAISRARDFTSSSVTLRMYPFFTCSRRLILGANRLNAMEFILLT